MSEAIEAAVRSVIASWANTGRIQPPSGNFWGSDIDKFTAEIAAALPPLRAGDREEIARAIYEGLGGVHWSEITDSPVASYPTQSAYLKAADYLLRTLSLPAVQGEWRDISTAPQNTFVDIWCAPYSRDQVFLDRGERQCRFRLVDGDWRNAQGGHAESNGSDNGQPYGLRVTHWMPLPAPPVAEPKS